MPAYKDSNTGKWYCKFYFEDYQGNRHQKLKRGFERKKDALSYERTFLESSQYQPTITFGAFVEIYRKDIYPQLRQHTIQTKNYRYNRIMPYFEDRPLTEITAIDIKKWQNDLIREGLKSTYINDLQKELSAVFNHAVKYYNLKENPTRQAGKATIPDEMPSRMRFWTLNEYRQVIPSIKDIKAKAAVNMLYWTGIRKGELYALTWADIDFAGKQVVITKSYQRLKGKDVITPTKTYESRTLLLPDTTIEQLSEYKMKCYHTAPDDPVFPWAKRFIEDGIKQGAEASGVSRIHVHGLRHSHASYLINAGVNIVLISKRLGHKDTSMTLDTYSHFFPTDEIDLIDKINKTI